MLDSWIRFVLNQRLLVLLITVGIIAIGVSSWITLPIDAFPDVTNVQVMILTESPGMAPVDVEEQVTFPIELAMQGLPDVREVRSTSRPALSQVVVVFEDDVDTYFARRLVFQRLESARQSLPSWAEPELGPISTGLGEIYQYTLESDRHSPLELRTIQDWLVATRLREIPGINEVNSFGGFVKQYQVLVDPELLLKYGIELRDVVRAVADNNSNVGGNYIVKGWEQAYVRTVGLLRSTSDIESIVLEAEDGTPVYLRQVAEVREGPETRQGAVTRDGKGETVAGMVIMLKGENSKVIVDRVKQAIPEIEDSLPEGVRISPFYDRTSLIQACIRTVSGALLRGGIFVIAVLFLLLGSFRVALIAAFSLPLTALFTFIAMRWYGVTANLMSLGGLAIAIGMIVDASIIVTENVARHLAESTGSGRPRLQVCYEAIREVARPVLFAVLIIIVVFLPLFTLEQMEGKMFKPLAITMCFATCGSLVVALTIVPAVSSYLLGGSRKQGSLRRLLTSLPLALIRRRGRADTVVDAGSAGVDSLPVRVLKAAYSPVLHLALRFRWVTVFVAFLAFLGVVSLLPRLGTEFLPDLDEGAIAINAVRLPSAALEGSVEVGTYIERRILEKFPEVETVVTKTGRAEIAEDPMGPEQNDFFIMLHPYEEWTTGRTREELVEAIQSDLSTIPGLRLAFSQPIALRVNELISGIKSDLAIKVFGPDLELLRETANRIAVVTGGIQGAEGVRVEQVTGFPQIEVIPDRAVMARYRINVDAINEIISTAVGGKVATTIFEGQKRFAALIRFPEEYREDKAAIERLLLPTPGGELVTLGQVAQVREVEAPAQISRENNMRRVVVECNVRGRDMGSFVTEVRDSIGAIVEELPAGYYVRFGGQFENQQRAMLRLSFVVPLSILLIFLMLFSAFGSMRSALLVLANLPFALIGGVLTLYLLEIPLSVSAAIGFIALFGMAVQDGTVLVSFFNRLRQEGLSTVEAVKRGCELRFTSVHMTTFTTLLGLAPMYFATGSGAEIQAPLATVVMGGMLSALLMVLVVLPALYCIVESGRESGS